LVELSTWPRRPDFANNIPWLWVAVSRLVGQVLGFVIGNRTDAMLALCWSDVPQDYRDKPVCTDHWGAYGRFFAGSQQQAACNKGSGKQVTVRVGIPSETRRRFGSGANANQV
jgi:IS1 family transposase